MMPRQIMFLDAALPALVLAFMAAALLLLVLDRLLVRWNLYRFLWYPSLFRLALFVCLFSCLGLLIYAD